MIIYNRNVQTRKGGHTEDMSNYDFHRIFEAYEFQDFARDMIQVRDHIILETFAEGADLGIDGRCVRDNGETIIFQAKRVLERKLTEVVKKEKEKLDSLSARGMRADRYILVISAEIGVEKKERIKEILQPYVKNPDDIVTGDDLNNYLGQTGSRYKGVERKYFKLWIQNTETLQRFLFETVNGPMVEKSRINLERVIKKANVFVETQVYKEALQKIQQNRVLIISGEPGAGKTTLAEQAGLYYYVKYGFSAYLYASTVEDLYAAQRYEGKKVIIFDDFWGSNGYDCYGNGAGVKGLVDFMQYIRQKNDCLLIMTTREYILEQGLRENADFRRMVEMHKLECRIAEYSDTEKLRIYLGHLKNSALTWSQTQSLLKIGNMVIRSQNYNPRIIEMYTQTITVDMDAQSCAEEFLDYLESPTDFWRKIYRELSQDAKTVYLIMATLPLPINLDIIKACYYAAVDQENGAAGMVNESGFGEVIAELERTIIRTDEFNQSSSSFIAASFQNPSVGDFIVGLIQGNLHQYKRVLMQCCKYFAQYIKLLEIVKEVKGDEEFYGQLIRQAIQSLDSDVVDFYDLYKITMRVNKEMSKFLQMYRAPLLGSEKNYGRLFQLIMMYDKLRCSEYEEWFRQVFSHITESIMKYPESVSREDLEMYPKAALNAVREGLCDDRRYLLEVYMNSLMKNRIRLKGGTFSREWKQEWESYKKANKDEIERYVRKFYRSECCMCAVRGNVQEFELLEFDMHEDFMEYGLDDKAVPEIQKYETWLEATVDDENKIEKIDDTIESYQKSITEIYQTFEEDYLYEIQPSEVEDPELWYRLNNISCKLQKSLSELEKNGHLYWDRFIEDEDSLEFLVSFLESGRRISENIMETIREVISYINESSSLDNEEMLQLLRSMASDSNHLRIWSKEELIARAPDIWLWKEEAAEELVKAKVLVNSGHWYRLANQCLMLACHIGSVLALSKEDRVTYYYGMFGLYEDWEATIDELIQWGQDWKYSRYHNLFLEALHEMEPVVFREDVLRKLARQKYEELKADTLEEIIRRIVKNIELEGIYSLDGELEGGTYTGEDYFMLIEYLGYDDLGDIFPYELSEEEISILEKQGLWGAESHDLILQDLAEKNLLELLGMKDKIIRIWEHIADLSKEEGNE